MLDYRLPYIYKNRQILLPWVEDWTDPQDHIRNLPIGKNGTDNLKWRDWFFCHPSAYRLFNDSIYISGTGTALLFGIISLIWWSFSFAVTCFVIAFIVAGLGYYKGRKYKLYYGKTFYDTQMRDWK